VGGMINHKSSLFGMDYQFRESRNNNGSLYEMTLTSDVALKYCEVKGK